MLAMRARSAQTTAVALRLVMPRLIGEPVPNGDLDNSDIG